MYMWTIALKFFIDKTLHVEDEGWSYEVDFEWGAIFHSKLKQTV